MPASSDYRKLTTGGWRVIGLTGFWDELAQRKILQLVDSQPRSRHPQTLTVRLPFGGGEQDCYLKIFHPASLIGGKDALRSSKALRAWKMGLELEAAGFSAPMAIAAGERRRAGLLQRAFLLTRTIDGLPAHAFLRDRVGDPGSWSLARKRAAWKKAARLVRRFHDAGFVHGDLVATNLFVSVEGGEIRLHFMDNDRTRRYPPWLPQPFWKRNLIQLNRMPLAGVTLQDRVRFFKAYRGIERMAARDRALARWLERATRRRRAECDGVDASGDFRRLMECPVETIAAGKTKNAGSR